MTLPAAKAVTTTNCVTVNGVPTTPCESSGGGNAVAWGMQRKVFYANGYWWIFWATGQASEGIYYQSCLGNSPTACTLNTAPGTDWSTPASLTTAASANLAGQFFDAYLNGTTLYYVLAPTEGATSFVWGAVSLAGAGGVISNPASYVVQDDSISFASTGLFGYSNDRASISIDGAGDLWVAFVTSSSNANGEPDYMSVFECVTNVVATPTNCEVAGNWDVTSNAFKLNDNENNYISPPSLLRADEGSPATHYMTLSFINLASNADGGPYDLYIAQAGQASGGTISWDTPCGGTAAVPSACTAPGNTAGIPGSAFSTNNAGNGAQYSAISSGPTVYAVASASGSTTVSFAYTIGTTTGSPWTGWGWTTATYTAVNCLATPTFQPTLSLSGNIAVLTYYNGNNYQWVFQWDSLANIASGAAGWACSTNLAWNTEQNPGFGDASPVSYQVTSGGVTYNLIGVDWNDNYGATQRIRFAVESVSNTGVVDFPVTLELSYYEYQSPASPRFQVSGSNYFTISYQVCNEAGCSGPGVAQYTSSAGAPLTITNVQSYSTWEVGMQTSASTNGEKWCLEYGTDCGVSQSYSASDGLVQSYYYYDQLAANNLYAIATPAMMSVWASQTGTTSTVNYDTVTSPTNVDYVLYPNPTSNQPWIGPRAAIWQTGGNDETVQYVRSRDILPGCSGQTIYPETTGGSTCSPTTSFGTITTGVPLSVSYPTVTVPQGIVEYVPIVLYNYQDVATSANLPQMITVNSADYSQYEYLTLQNVEFFTATGAILPSWLESGNLNTATNTVYWVNLQGNTIAAATAGSMITSGTTSAATPEVLTDAAASWTANQYVGDYLEYTSGPAAGQFMLISANTANTISTTNPFNPGPTPAGTDNFKVINVNPSPITIYMGFGQNSASTNFFNANGPVGEAPTLSPSYDEYDDGASVFSNYWNFAGNALPAAFTTTWFSGQATAGSTNVLLKDANAQWAVNSGGNGQWIGDYLTYTSGVDSGQTQVITQSTLNTITTAAFTSAPNVNDNFIITTGSGLVVNNGVTFTGTQTTVFETTAGTYSDALITESNVQVPNQAATGGIMLVNSEFSYDGLSTSTTNQKLTDTNANWAAGEWVGDYLYYTSGNAAGQSLVITGSTVNTISTTATFNPAPSAASYFSIEVPLQVSPYTYGTWYTGGGNCQIVGNACNGVDIDVDGGNFRSVANGLTTNTPSSVNPGISSYIDGATTELTTQYSGLTTSTSSTSATVAGNPFTAGQFVNDYLRFTSGPAAGQEELISSNTANTITVSAAFLPIPTAAGGDSFIVISGDTVQYVNEVPERSGSFISSNVPTSGNNFYIAAGVTTGQVLSFNWIRQRIAPPSGVMPTVMFGPATEVGVGPDTILAYAPITLTNNMPVATPLYFQADVNVTSDSTPIFSGTTSSTVGAVGTSGVAQSASGNQLTVSGSPWNAGQWIGFSLEWLNGPAAGQVSAISGNTNDQITTTLTFNPAPQMGNGFEILPASTLTDLGQSWAPGSYIGDYLEYISGPAAGQWEQITENTATTLTTIAPKPAPTGGGGDSFVINSGFAHFEASTLDNVQFFVCPGPCSTTATAIPSWLESGASNNAVNSVYWVNLPGSLAATTGSMTIYIGFASTGTNLFSSTGYEGGAPNQGPTYGIYDNGAVVFNFYDNFAGTALDSQWASTSTINNNEGIAAAIGQLGAFTDFQNEAGSTPYTNNDLNPSGSTLDSSGNLWVADSGYNRVVEYPAPLSSGETASVEVGQPLNGGGNSYFGSSAGNNGGESASTLSNPRAVAFDSSGDLWVADTGNNRILEYVPGTSGCPAGQFCDGMAATLELGQASGVNEFTTNSASAAATGLSAPRAIAFDAAGNLWVADSGNNRVLEFVKGSGFTMDQAASIVIGQTAFGNGGAATQSNRLNTPSGIAISGADIWVSDTLNNRLMEFQPGAGTTPLFSGTTTAGDTSTAVWDTSASWGANAYAGDYAVFTSGADAGGSYLIASNTAHELLFNAPGFAPAPTGAGNDNFMIVSGYVTGESASIVLGQGPALATGTTTSAAANKLTDTNANWPVNAFVNYYLEYTTGPAQGQALVITANTANTITTANFSPVPTAGGGDNFIVVAYQTGNPNQGLAFPSAQSLNTPLGIAVDSSGNVWVADSGNNRVLSYTAPFSPSASADGQAASLVMGQSSFTSTAPSTSASGEDVPRAVTFDSSGNLWVTDTDNNRIVEIPSAGGFTNDKAATMVLGQPGFNLTPSAINLYDPTSAAFDSSGNLWVADSGNNRILEYAYNGYQFYTGEPATLVIGQANLPNGNPNFASSSSGDGANQLNDPTYIAFDSAGDLWVADTGNNRILEYVPGTGTCPKLPTPLLCSGMSASVVIGQPGFGSGAPNNGGESASTLDNPHEFAFDYSGNLWVADTGNNRVVEFQYNAGFSSGEAASVVLGQNVFNTNGANAFPAFSGSISAGSATNYVVDSAAFWATNEWAGSTLTFTSPGPDLGVSLLITSNTLNTITTTLAAPAAPAAGATFVIGPSATSLSSPYGVAFNSGNIWVADTGNNRVLEFQPKFQTAEAATTVIGQDFLWTDASGVGAANLKAPTGISFGYWNDLWVADTANNRVVQFQPTYNTLFSGMSYNYIQGNPAGSYQANQQGTVANFDLNYPMAVTFDPIGNLWEADTGNNRVGGSGTGSLNVDNGVTVRQTSNWMGVVSKVTINPLTNILEFYGYMSNPNSNQQNFGYATPQANTPVPGKPVNLDVFSTDNNWYSVWDCNPGSCAAESLISAITLPPSTPTMSWLEAYPDNTVCGSTGLPNQYPLAANTCSATQSMTMSDFTYWALRNSTAEANNVIPGAIDQRWAASPNQLGWIMTSPDIMQAAVPYYLQYGNTFKIVPGGLVTSFTAGVTFVIYGQEYGVQYFPITTLSSALTSQVLYVDAGTTVLFPEQGSGMPAGVRWENSNNQSQSVEVGLTNPNTQGGCTTLCTATYYEQYEQYLEYVTSDHSVFPASTVPVITYYTFSREFNLNIPTSTRTIWIDALTVANITAAAPGSTPYEHWLAPTSKWTITCTNTNAACNNEIPAPAIIYYHQWEQELLNYKTSDYLTQNSGSPLKITYTVNDTQVSTILNFTGSMEVGTAASSTNQQLTVNAGALVTATDTSDTANTLTDAGANWIPDQWAGYYLTYTSGGANGQSLQILSNTATTILTAKSFSPAPSGGDDNFIISIGPGAGVGWANNEWLNYALTYTSGPAVGQELRITGSTSNTISTTGKFNPAPDASGDGFEIVDLVWMDAGTTASVTGRVCVGPCATAVQSWVPDTGDGNAGSWSISSSNCATNTLGVLCAARNPSGGIYGPMPGFLGKPLPGGNASIIYDHQFLVNFVTIPPGSPSPPSVHPYPLQISTCPELNSSWCQDGASYAVVTQGYPGTPAVWQTTPFMLLEGGNATLIAQGFGTPVESPQDICFEASGSCVTSTTSANVLALMSTGSSSYTIDAFFQLQEGITFTQTNSQGVYPGIIPNGDAEWSVNVYCNTVGGCDGPYGNTPDGQIVKTGESTTSALLIADLDYDTYTYEISSPVMNMVGDVSIGCPVAGDCEFFPTPSLATCSAPMTTCTATLNAAKPSVTVTVTFQVVYQLSALSDPLWTAGIQATSIVNGTTPVVLACSGSSGNPPWTGPGCSQSDLVLWLLPGSSVTLTATIGNQFTGAQPIFIQWTDSGSCTLGACTSPTLTLSNIQAANIQTANYGVGFQNTVWPSSGSDEAGGSTYTVVYVFGGIGQGSVSVNPASLPAGVTVDFCYPYPTCAPSTPNSITFPTSTEPIGGQRVFPGAAIYVVVSLAATSTIFGAFPITINTGYGGAVGLPANACGTAGQPKCPVFTLDVITPEAETVGASDAYGITTPGQTAIAYANGNWLTFYYGQNSLVYSYSPNGNTWDSGGIVPTGLISSATLTTPGTTPTVLHDAAASWTANQWVGYYLTYTDNGAAGESRLVISNTATTITVGVAFAPGVPTPGGGDSFGLSDGGVHGYSFAVTTAVSGGNTYVYIVQTSSNNNTIGSAKPGNYFYWDYGTVAASGIITWANPTATSVPLCTTLSCPLYGAGQPSIVVTPTAGGSALLVAVPVLADVGKTQTWFIQLWQSTLGLGVPGAFVNASPPLPANFCNAGCPAGLIGGIVARVPANGVASAVNLKLLNIPSNPGVVALVDWIGNDLSVPSVAIYNTGTGLFTQWSNVPVSPDPYSCTPAVGGDGNTDDYLLYGEQSDMVANANFIYFAGQNGATASESPQYSGDVIYFAFNYNNGGTQCLTQSPPTAGASGYTTPGVVGGVEGGIPPTPVPNLPWRVTLSYGANGITLGFGEQDVLGSATGTCDASGNCVWVVLPGTVSEVQGMINGLSSIYSSSTSNVGTVWVETSPSSPTGYIVAFALI